MKTITVSRAEEAAILRRRQAKGRQKIQGRKLTHVNAKPDRGRVLDKGYLAYLRRQPCCVGPLLKDGCSGRIDPAHLRFTDRSVGRTNPGLGRKSDDRWCLPVCRKHHDAQHAYGNEAEWWALVGADPNALAIEHYAAFQDPGMILVGGFREGQGSSRADIAACSLTRGTDPQAFEATGKEAAMSEDEPARTTLTDRTQVYPGHREIIKDGERQGQQKGYVVLAQEEIDKGFTRPYRDAYRHLKCGTVTTMGRTLSETYARDPNFYSGTFCCGCGAHFPVGEDGEFVWTLDGSKVGT